MISWVRFSVVQNDFLLPLAKRLESTSILKPNVLHAHLVTVHHEVVCGYQGFEDHHPAGIADPLHQRVDHLGHVHVGLVLGGLDQVWGRNEPSSEGAEHKLIKQEDRWDGKTEA